MALLSISHLYAGTQNREILKDFSLEINRGEVHAIMGPNGAGKSTLVNLLAGHPHYNATRGEVSSMGKNLLELDPEERSLLGLFIGFQYPVEISGLTNLQFLHAAHSAHQKHREKEPLDEGAFRHLLEGELEALHRPKDLVDREVNSGFSGGEKKWNEILQMRILAPQLIVLDEIDSGLDIDAMRAIANHIERQLNRDNALLLITHYPRFLDFVIPHFVHIVTDGTISRSGGPSLAKRVEKEGYGARDG